MDKNVKAKMIRGSSFSLAGTILMLVFHFLSLKILAEYMPLEEFGVFALLMAVSQGFVVVGGLGLALTLVKNLAGDDDPRQQRKTIYGVIVLRAFLVFLLGMFVITCGRLLLPGSMYATIGKYLLYLPLLFGLALARETLFNIFQGRQQFHWYAVVKTLSSLVRFTGISFLAWKGQLGVEALIWVEILTTTATVATLSVLAGSTLLGGLGEIRLSQLNDLIRFSTPLYLNDLFKYFYDAAALLLAGILLSPGSVALLAAATKLPDALRRLFTSLTVVYFPNITQLIKNGSRSEGQTLLNVALVIVSTGVTWATLTTFIFGREIVLLLFSDQYISSSSLLAILMLAFLFHCTGYLMGSTAVAAGHSSVPLRVSIVTSVINVFACLMLIPQWDVLGAALAQLIANAFAQIIYWYQLANIGISLRTREVTMPILLGFLTAACYLLLPSDHLFIRIAAIGLYPLLCWFFVPATRRFCESGIVYLSNQRWKISS